MALSLTHSIQTLAIQFRSHYIVAKQTLPGLGVLQNLKRSSR